MRIVRASSCPVVDVCVRPRQGQAGVVQDGGRRQAGAPQGDDGG